MLASLDIRKPVDEKGEVIEPTYEYVDTLASYATTLANQMPGLQTLQNPRAFPVQHYTKKFNLEGSYFPGGNRLSSAYG